jgi:hypothetical protein
MLLKGNCMDESKVDEEKISMIGLMPENIHNGDYDENEPSSVFVSKREYGEYKQYNQAEL